MIVQHIRSADNKPADTLSRANMGDAFQMHPAIVNALADSVDGLDIDRFATSQNHVLPAFNTYFYEEGSVGTDAFAQTDWERVKNFCNPPFSQLNRLVAFLRDFHPNLPRAIIIAPKWVQQPWY